MLRSNSGINLMIRDRNVNQFDSKLVGSTGSQNARKIR